MFHILQDPKNRVNDDIEGFGMRWDSYGGGIDLNYPSIAGGAQRTVMFKLLSEF